MNKKYYAINETVLSISDNISVDSLGYPWIPLDSSGFFWIAQDYLG